jgi:hypothetical protein
LKLPVGTQRNLRPLSSYPWNLNPYLLTSETHRTWIAPVPASHDLLVLPLVSLSTKSCYFLVQLLEDLYQPERN